jgi:hypothetical protein
MTSPGGGCSKNTTNQSSTADYHTRRIGRLWRFPEGLFRWARSGYLRPPWSYLAIEYGLDTLLSFHCTHRRGLLTIFPIATER